jgi:branched-chain amino acid transport system substrate-binding protein
MIAFDATAQRLRQGLADAFRLSSKQLAARTWPLQPDGKADYSAEVSVLASAGGRDHCYGYVDQVVRASSLITFCTGAVDTFCLSDGMVGAVLNDSFGAQS